VKEKLRLLCEALRNQGLWAELGENLDNINRDSYLLRFKVPDDDGNNLALMGDLGVTWEPWRVWSTPCYCTVSLDDIQATADKLVRVAKAWKDGKLPAEAGRGEGAAENI
jgi:hypothetical protein